MKAIINPQTKIFKQLTEAQYKADQPYFEADGFRLMNDKEIQKHYGYTPAKADETGSKRKSKEK